MGKVNLYERQSLDSSLVGTPGIMTAGNDLMDMAGDAAKLTQQGIALQTAKIEVADNIEAEKHRIGFENELYKQSEDAKQKSINNPYDFSDGAYDMGMSLASKTASQITNPRVRDKFLEKSQSSIESFQNQAKTWAEKTTADNAYINLSDSMDSIESQAGQIRNVTDIVGLVNSAKRLAVQSATVVGVERANKVFEATQKGIYQNFAYSRIDNAPGTIKQLVDSGVFNGVMDEKEQLALKNTATGLIRKRELEVQRANRSAHISSISTLYDKEANGTLTVAEVNNAISQFQRSGAGVGEIKSLLAIKKSLIHGDSHGGSGSGGKHGNKVDYQTQANTLTAITDDYLDIFTKTTAAGKLKSRDTSLSDLQNLQNKIVQAASEKKLDKQTANSMLKNIVRGKHALMDTKTSVTTNPGGIFGVGKQTKEIPLGIYNDGMRGINSWANNHISDPKQRARFKQDAISSYVNSYDGVKSKKGFTVNKYTNQIIAHYAPQYGKSVQVKKVK